MVPPYLVSLMYSQLSNYYQIRRQPISIFQMIHRQPSRGFMFPNLGSFTDKGTQKAIHRKMKLRIIILHSCQKAFDTKRGGKLFLNLADQRFFRRLPRLDPSPGNSQ